MEEVREVTNEEKQSGRQEKPEEEEPEVNDENHGGTRQERPLSVVEGEGRVFKEQERNYASPPEEKRRPELPPRPSGTISPPPMLASGGTLNLSKKKITGFPDSVIFSEQEYKERVIKLNLEGNAIVTLDPMVSYFSNLSLLDLTANRVLSSLPPSLGLLSSLRV
jgi:hypothetical protein